MHAPSGSGKYDDKGKACYVHIRSPCTQQILFRDIAIEARPCRPLRPPLQPSWAPTLAPMASCALQSNNHLIAFVGAAIVNGQIPSATSVSALLRHNHSHQGDLGCNLTSVLRVSRQETKSVCGRITPDRPDRPVTFALIVAAGSGLWRNVQSTG